MDFPHHHVKKKYQGHFNLLDFRILYREDDETAGFAKYHPKKIEINSACTTPTHIFLSLLRKIKINHTLSIATGFSKSSQSKIKTNSYWTKATRFYKSP